MEKENKVIELQEATFIRKHAKKIIFGGSVLFTTTTLYILRKHDIEIQCLKVRIADIRKYMGVNTEIAMNSLKSTIEQCDFKIEDLNTQKENFTQAAYNVYVRTPRIEEEIKLLEEAKQLAIENLNTLTSNIINAKKN